MAAPHVSVIIPAYRENPAMLEACVRSVVNQQYAPVAIYLVLDPACSLDVARTAGLLAQDTKIQVLQDTRRGAAAHRNLGVSQALNTSDLLAFTDADCVADPGWLKELVACMERHPADIGCVGGINISDETNLIARAIACAESSFMGGGGVSGQTTIQKRETIINSVPNCNALFRKEVWLQNQQDENLFVAEDGEMNLRLANMGWKFVQTPRAKIFHKREESLRKYARKMAGYGKAAATIIRKHDLTAARRYWYSLALVGFYLLLGLFFIAAMAGKKRKAIAGTMVGLYVLALLTAGFWERKRHDRSSCLLVFAVLIIQHLSYAYGFIKGAVSYPAYLSDHPA